MRRSIERWLAAILFAMGCARLASAQGYPLPLRFDTPATQLTEAIPLGNGPLGASAFEGVVDVRILLDESSVWSGSRKPSDRPEAAQYPPEIRRLLLAGDNAASEKLVNAHFTSLGKGSDSAASGNYQELGSLNLIFEYGGAETLSGYERTLDLRSAVSRCSFVRGGVRYTRERFSSAPDQVVVMRLTSSLVQPGGRTATLYYGARGWVAHVMTNPWGFTSPGQVASWGSTMIGSAWLCQHILDRVLYTGDVAFLPSMYPVLKGASEFYLDMLIAEPKHGWLVTAPSNSPENSFYLPDGGKASIAMGPAGIVEMLMQSREGDLRLLPALP